MGEWASLGGNTFTFYLFEVFLIHENKFEIDEFGRVSKFQAGWAGLHVKTELCMIAIPKLMN